MRASRFLPAVLILFLALALPAAGSNSSGHAVQQEKITIRVAYESPVGGAVDITAKAWKNIVQRRSNFRVDVQLFPAGQLFNDRDAAAAVSAGNIDMNFGNPSWMGQYERGVQAFDLPYAFNTEKEFAEAWNGDIGKILNRRLAKRNVRGVYMWPLSGRDIIATKKPVVTLRDVSDLKIRVFGGKPHELAFDALGASGLTIPFPEVASAVQTGVVDGLITGMSFWYVAFPDTLPYAVDPGAWHAGFVVWTNTKFWSKVPPNIKQVLLKAFVTAGNKGRANVRTLEQQAIASDKVHVTILTCKQRQAWRRATQGVAKKFAGEIGADLAKIFVAKSQRVVKCK